MKIKHYTKEMLNKIRGKLPMVVFIWYTIFVFVIVAMLIFVAFWYYVFYDTAYNIDASALEHEPYEKMLDTKKLDRVIEVYYE